MTTTQLNRWVNKMINLTFDYDRHISTVLSICTVVYVASPLPCLCLGPVKHEGEVNVLLVGSGDPRHILKTIAGLQNEKSLHVRLCKLFILHICLPTVSPWFHHSPPFEGVGDRKQHGRHGQTTAAPLPGTDAPGKHGTQWWVGYCLIVELRWKMCPNPAGCLHREDRGLSRGVWEQWDPQPDRGNTETCSIPALSVCYRYNGDGNTPLSEHSSPQGTTVYWQNLWLIVFWYQTEALKFKVFWFHTLWMFP